MFSLFSRPFPRKAVRAAALSALVVATLAPAAANADIWRVNAARQSCDALQGVIADQGAVIVRSPSPYSGTTLSERYVANRGFCYANEIVRYRTVVTRDTDRCSVLLCTEREKRRRRF